MEESEPKISEKKFGEISPEVNLTAIDSLVNGVNVFNSYTPVYKSGTNDSLPQKDNEPTA